MVSARPRRDNTLWQRTRKRAPPNLQRPWFQCFTIHRTNRGLYPYWKGDAVVTFNVRWNVAVCAGALGSTQQAVRLSL
jgi:hypothetical protein